MAALTKQVAYGPCKNAKTQQEIGYFDWFGNDRQKAWLELGNLEKTDAMADLVHLGMLFHICLIKSQLKLQIEGNF